VEHLLQGLYGVDALGFRVWHTNRQAYRRVVDSCLHNPANVQH